MVFGFYVPTNTLRAADFKFPLDGESTVIVVGKGQWTLAERNNKALEYLSEKAGAQKGFRHGTFISVTPTDKATMVEFRFGEGLGKPTWTVKFGYDGKVAGHSKAISLF